MSKMKAYMEELAEKLGKEINELTQEDMDKDFSEKEFVESFASIITDPSGPYKNEYNKYKNLEVEVKK
jgi:hypothetical protein